MRKLSLIVLLLSFVCFSRGNELWSKEFSKLVQGDEHAFLQTVFDRTWQHVSPETQDMASDQETDSPIKWVLQLLNSSPAQAFQARDQAGDTISIPSWAFEEPTEAKLEEWLNDGHTLVHKPEKANMQTTVLNTTRQALDAIFLDDVTVHSYISGRGTSALRAHTDPYSVFVKQLFGRKAWRVCLPSDEVVARAQANVSMPIRTVAQKALLQEIIKQQPQGNF